MLHLLGALDDKGAVTSPVGAGMALYPLDPSLSRMLVEATR
jgi:HrpA-like RNA helicase